MWTLRILVHHKCPPACHDGWKRPHGVKYLARTHFPLVANNRKIPGKFVQDEARLQHGNKISDRQSNRTVHAIRKVIEGDESDHFKMIRGFLYEIQDCKKPLQTTVEEGVNQGEVVQTTYTTSPAN